MDPYKRAIWYGVYDPVGQDDCLSWVFLFGGRSGRKRARGAENLHFFQRILSNSAHRLLDLCPYMDSE